MIRVINEKGIEILLNTEHIQRIGSDENRRAVIFLTNGEVLKVKNPVYDVIQKTKAYLKGIKEERRDYEKKRSEEPNKKDKEDKRKKQR